MNQVFKLLLAVTFSIMAALSTQAATIYVRTTGNDGNSGASAALAKLTIANAIAAASNGDVIDIGPGTYNQGGTALSINKDITLSGPFPTTTGYGPTRFNAGFTQAGNPGEAIITGSIGFALITIDPAASNVTIQGLTITNNSAGDLIRDNVAGVNLTLLNNRFAFSANDAVSLFSAMITARGNHFFGYSSTILNSGINGAFFTHLLRGI